MNDSSKNGLPRLYLHYYCVQFICVVSSSCYTFCTENMPVKNFSAHLIMAFPCFSDFVFPKNSPMIRTRDFASPFPSFPARGGFTRDFASLPGTDLLEILPPSFLLLHNIKTKDVSLNISFRLLAVAPNANDSSFLMFSNHNV